MIQLWWLQSVLQAFRVPRTRYQCRQSLYFTSDRRPSLTYWEWRLGSWSWLPSQRAACKTWGRRLTVLVAQREQMRRTDQLGEGWQWYYLTHRYDIESCPLNWVVSWFEALVAFVDSLVYSVSLSVTGLVNWRKRFPALLNLVPETSRV